MLGVRLEGLADGTGVTVVERVVGRVSLGAMGLALTSEDVAVRVGVDFVKTGMVRLLARAIGLALTVGTRAAIRLATTVTL